MIMLQPTQPSACMQPTCWESLSLSQMKCQGWEMLQSWVLFDTTRSAYSMSHLFLRLSLPSPLSCFYSIFLCVAGKALKRCCSLSPIVPFHLHGHFCSILFLLSCEHKYFINLSFFFYFFLSVSEASPKSKTTRGNMTHSQNNTWFFLPWSFRSSTSALSLSFYRSWGISALVSLLCRGRKKGNGSSDTQM